MITTLASAFHRNAWLPLCLGLLVGLIAASALYSHQQQQLLESQDQDYGRALSTLAARQAVDATLNHDLVSLQVILRDIASNGRVVNATIHDVENRLLVQAGDSASPGSLGLRNFSAPVTFHDSVAGHVTITLNQQQHSRWPIINMSLLILLGFVALLLARLQPVTADRKEEAHTPQTAQRAEDDDLPQFRIEA